jgi:hypothetical protein
MVRRARVRRVERRPDGTRNGGFGMDFSLGSSGAA